MKKRYHVLDMLRGFALINMIAYHTLWDVVNIFGTRIAWYSSREAYWWQQFICSTFILLSGFCFSLGSHKLKRGLLILASSAAITLVTVIFMPESRIIFGILSLIGSATLIMIPLDRFISRVNVYAGMTLSLLAYVLTKSIGKGYVGVGKLVYLLPRKLYSNLFTAYLGFPDSSFSSSDYFPILPWLFLFLVGYFLYGIFKRNMLLRYLERKTVLPLEFCGRHSLVIYLLHQPLIYAALILIYKFA